MSIALQVIALVLIVAFAMGLCAIITLLFEHRAAARRIALERESIHAQLQKEFGK